MIANVWTRACNGASSCVELRWVTASSCNNGSCIAVTCTNGEIWVRDSKLGDASPVLRFTIGSWWSYLAAVRSRQLGTWGGPVLLVRDRPGWWRMWRDGDWDTALEFTDGEVAGFVAGVEADALSAPAGNGPGRPPGSTLPGSGVEIASV